MNSYHLKQKTLFNSIEKGFKSGESPSTIVEQVDDYENDDQICLTAVGFVSEKLQTAIRNKIIDPLKKIEPEQYYYPSKSLHLTIQNIRTINKPPLFTNVDVEKAKRVFSKIINKHPKIHFTLDGLFELPTSLGIRAYAEESLVGLCTELKQELATAGIPDNKTYASNKVLFGNITISRFRRTPTANFFKKVNKLKNIKFGELVVRSVFLITTNSVCHPQKTRILGEFILK